MDNTYFENSYPVEPIVITDDKDFIVKAIFFKELDAGYSMFIIVSKPDGTIVMKDYGGRWLQIINSQEKINCILKVKIVTLGEFMDMIRRNYIDLAIDIIDIIFAMDNLETESIDHILFISQTPKIKRLLDKYASTLIKERIHELKENEADETTSIYLSSKRDDLLIYCKVIPGLSKPLYYIFNKTLNLGLFV